MKRLTIPNIRFCLGIREVTGKIHAEQGIPLFYCPSENIIAVCPFKITSEQYGCPLTVYVYDGTNIIVTKMNDDMVPIEEMTDSDLDVFNDFAELEGMAEEQKIRNATKVFQAYSNVILAFIAVVICFFLRSYRLCLYLLFCAIGVLMLNLFSAISLTRALDSSRVYDEYGNWVDIDSGETNLCGGFKLPLNKEDNAL